MGGVLLSTAHIPPLVLPAVIVVLSVMSLAVAERPAGKVGTGGTAMGPQNLRPSTTLWLLAPRSASLVHVMHITLPETRPRTSFPPKLIFQPSRPGKPLAVAGWP
jgi:hypothetical protein